LPKDDFAYGFPAVLDLLFAKSSFSKESRVSDG